ncbi:hypothetical protein M231_06102 [Tremella mesenterica]|uniref:Uncharacterized protein n=2 Tax=Tremella mesenterica TaxID=5217 RepID=A0A4Q1BCS2_TREME|nr:hypothetical protein M231_06102 [Tremella mesenterica]
MARVNRSAALLDIVLDYAVNMYGTSGVYVHSGPYHNSCCPASDDNGCILNGWHWVSHALGEEGQAGEVLEEGSQSVGEVCGNVVVVVEVVNWDAEVWVKGVWVGESADEQQLGKIEG